MWDSEYGGFYWRIKSQDGAVVESGKHLYGQAFALFAISEYAIAAKNPEAGSFARQTYRLLDERAHDERHGGYKEYFLRDWVVPASGSGFLGHGPSVKSLNTHIHILEALMRYTAIDGEQNVFDRVRELLRVFNDRAVRANPKAGAYGIERHTQAWVAFDSPEDRRASYGHDVELAWLLEDANRLLENLPSKLSSSLFKHALNFGFDVRHGGFYESGYFGHAADRMAKLWWVQAEGLLGLLKMYDATGDSAYADRFLQTLDWIDKRQVDWKHGEWFPEVDEHGRRRGDKGGPWKTPYHEARALLECLAILES